jgi:hypothetical protein
MWERRRVSGHLAFQVVAIATVGNSTLRMLLAGKAIATVRERSEWSITETGGLAGLALSDGRIGLTIARQLMAHDDILHVRTPNVLASVRGSSVIVEVQRILPGAGIASVFSVLSGPVEIVAVGTTVRVGSRQPLRIRDNVVGLVEGLSNEETELLAADFKGTRQHSSATLEFSEMLEARERDRALGHVLGRVDGSLGATATGPRRDEILIAPRVSDVCQRHDTAATPARCAAQAAGARGIVRESDSSTSAP